MWVMQILAPLKGLWQRGARRPGIALNIVANALQIEKPMCLCCKFNRPRVSLHSEKAKLALHAACGVPQDAAQRIYTDLRKKRQALAPCSSRPS